jgi:hypothetical protein
MLPQGCGPYIFGHSGLRLPHLAELYLEGVENPNTYIHGAYLTGKDVQSIAACWQSGCLRKLSLLAVLGGEVNYGVLSALTTLTHLSLKEVGTRGLHQLVSLEELCLEYASLSDDTLVGIAWQLTPLTCLDNRHPHLSKRASSIKCASWSYQVTNRFRFWSGRECQPVCQQLAQDLREAGILPAEPHEQLA